MEIATARLRLDDLRQADAPALLAYRGDPAVGRYQGWKPASLADATRFIEGQAGAAPERTGTWWQRAIRLRDTGALIGDVGLHAVDDATVELGISIAPAQQRHGYAREALEAILDFAFGGLRKARAIAFVHPRNVASLRLLEGLGMRRHGDHADTVMLELPAREWLAAPAGGDKAG